MRRSLRRNVLVAAVASIGCALGVTGCPLLGNPNAPQASFTASPTEGVLPLTVQFKDTSLPGTATLYIWFWDFGDGSYANTPNPSHTYSTPGVYTVSLTVESAEGKSTHTKTDLITVSVRSAFEVIGPEGGAVSAGGARVVVPANARAEDTAVGVTALENAFAIAFPETTVVLSGAFRISHDGLDTTFAGVQGAETLVPSTIELPFLANAVPAADRNGDKIHIVAQLQNGLDVPIFGQVQGNRIAAQVTGLPNRAVYGVVYRPAAFSRVVTPPAGKALSTGPWLSQWRVRLSPLMAQQLTALRLGDIDTTSTYLRTDFAQVEVDVTLAALDQFLAETTATFQEAGLRSPLLLNSGDAYELSLYNLSDLYLPDFEDLDDVAAAVRLFGSLVLDPRQLINISLHNAALAGDDPDAAQELSLENAFAQTLYQAAYDGYDYPLVTAASAADLDTAGQPRQISFAEALNTGVAVYAGQRLDGYTSARSFVEGERAELSKPLLAAFAADTPGYAAATQDFLTFLANAFDIEPFAFLFSSAPATLGIIEGVRVALATLEDTPTFDEATEEMRLAVSESLSTFFGQSLGRLYWVFARARGVEAGADAALRPSDAERVPFTLQTDQFTEDAVVEAAFAAAADEVLVSAATESALRDIPPLSSRAVVVEVDPETPNLKFTFNREAWEMDSLGNSVAVKVYPEGRDGVELGPEQTEIILNPFTPPCPLPDDDALLVQVLFPIFDADGNGGLSFEETLAVIPSINAFIFSIADADDDNLLSLQEVLGILPSFDIDPLALVDSNGDGFLSRSELGGLSGQQFALLDVNENGYFDCGDLVPAGKQDVPESPGKVIVLISNLNLSAANSVYVNAARPSGLLGR